MTPDSRAADSRSRPIVRGHGNDDGMTTGRMAAELPAEGKSVLVGQGGIEERQVEGNRGPFRSEGFQADSASAQPTVSWRLASSADRIAARVVASSSTTRTRISSRPARQAGPHIFRLGWRPAAVRLRFERLGYTLAGFAMKKLAIGCGIVLVIAVVAGGIGAYYLFYKAQTMIAGLSELKAVPALDRQVRNTTSYTPPASGELSSGQVATYIAIREQVRQKLGERVKELDARYKSLSERIIAMSIRRSTSPRSSPPTETWPGCTSSASALRSRRSTHATCR